jgi:hypothetical protein
MSSTASRGERYAWISATENTMLRRARSIDGFAVNLGDRVGVLRPIAHQRVCAGCHGPEDKLDPRVRRTLNEFYPGDRAVGFHEGELRGWFWAEVPNRP